MNVTLRAGVVHLCPFVDEVDVGTVEISYELGVDAPLIELHELHETLNDYSDQKITHEAMTGELATRLGVPVTSRWTTAGIDIEIVALPNGRRSQ